MADPAVTVNVAPVMDIDGLLMLATRALLVPAWATLKPLNVATPVPSDGCDVVPLRVPPPSRLSVTVLLLIKLPNASMSWTVTADGKVVPARIVEGASCKNWKVLGGPATTTNGAAGELERPVAGAEAVRV